MKRWSWQFLIYFLPGVWFSFPMNFLISPNELYDLKYLHECFLAFELPLTLNPLTKEIISRKFNLIAFFFIFFFVFLEQELPNEIFSLFRKSNGHRSIGFHSLYAVIGSFIFTLLHWASRSLNIKKSFVNLFIYSFYFSMDNQEHFEDLPLNRTKKLLKTIWN